MKLALLKPFARWGYAVKRPSMGTGDGRHNDDAFVLRNHLMMIKPDVRKTPGQPATGGDQASTAMSSGPFDGSWSVVVACAQAPDGAKAYRWNFTARVRDGSFMGQYNQPGNIPSGTLSGQIQPTGNAHLTMDGLTGDPDYSLSRVHAGTPIHYTATAQFTARSGTGTRDQARHCDLAFSKI
jgi:hypothetical protein